MSKIIFYTMLVSFLFMACKKTETPLVQPIQYTATMGSINSIPGETAIIRFNKAVKKPILDVSLNSRSIKAYSINDSVYSFIVPVLSAGDYDVTFQDVVLQSKLNFSVRSYPVLAQPQVMIDSFSTAINKSIDSLTKLSNATVAPINKAIIPFVKQLQDELNTSLASLSAEEKIQFAYFVREHKIDFTNLTSSSLPAVYYNAQTGMYSDPGEELVKVSQEMALRVSIAVATIPVVIATTVGFALAPNPLTASLASASFLSYIIAREAAGKKAEEVGKLKGVIESIFDISSKSANRTIQTIRNQQSGYANTSTVPEFKPDVAQILTMKVEYRNLIKTDTGLHNNISNAIKKDAELVNEDKSITSNFDKIRNLLKKVNLNWIVYTSKIPDAIAGKTSYVVPASSISIKSISDNRLNYTASSVDSGISVKINSAVTENINFSFVVGYKSSLINKSLEKSFPAKYLGAIDTAAVLVSHGKWVAVSGSDIGGDSVNVVLNTFGTQVPQGQVITRVCTHLLTAKTIYGADIQFYNGTVKTGSLNQTEDYDRMQPFPTLPNCIPSAFVKNISTDADTFEWQYLPDLKVIRVKITTPNNQGLADTGTLLDFKILSFSKTRMELQILNGINNAPPSKIRYVFN